MKDKIAKIEKIVVNTGIGRLSTQPNFQEKTLPELIKEIAALTGQKPAVCVAKKSIAGFKLRKGTPVGLKTTLRGNRMRYFFEKVIKVVLPRLRDFRGIDLKSVDKGGNLNIGIKEHQVFPEISPEVSNVSFGVEITIVPRQTGNREEAIALYRELGVPLKKHA
ncbi:MAG: 50S ribosomal protein L5 [Candidatus Harrisonbacteria bacterium RIFCSPHIGHO2_01_FULL_44_13]|uniref:50S ribosomal protein L5 n=1 Tax=Candidatus Harrisonbacteria bacterium RIFCSPLOWO2_01_FULL_44_18 TaxID=1798407 RepID=A0A1G1ZP73_9BACT|nr:MAG: 50S ribosomal protein L5 [Candidatus Harrisonbacteria bacterium RIFCSPHIGHO2_01_FULL_44_13]OGY65956.1 MAG: 50S ribosomal protein L5 [Candidatus Harrisonbacteria bacterium RIFCSPLOWO2_01_FULL_44_18]